jgi:hypothetical protein
MTNSELGDPLHRVTGQEATTRQRVVLDVNGTPMATPTPVSRCVSKGSFRRSIRRAGSLLTQIVSRCEVSLLFVEIEGERGVFPDIRYAPGCLSQHGQLDQQVGPQS